MPPTPPLDSLFGPYDVRAATPAPLDPPAVWRIGYAAAAYLRSVLTGYDRYDPQVNRVIIAYDGRPTSAPLYAALRDGILSSEVGVLDAGPLDWPTLSLATIQQRALGGAMVTAGRQPPGQAGIRFVGQKARSVTNEVGLVEIARISARVVAHGRPPMQPAVRYDAIELHKQLIAAAMPPLPVGEPLRLNFDPLGGVMSAVVPAVLAHTPGLQIAALKPPLNLGIRTSPAPDPNQPQADQRMADALVHQQADLGVAFDGDGRRVAFFGRDAKRIPAAAIARVILRSIADENPAAAVLLDSTLAHAIDVQAVGMDPAWVQIEDRPGPWFRKTMQDRNADFGASADGRYYFGGQASGLEFPLLALTRVLSAIVLHDRPLDELVNTY